MPAEHHSLRSAAVSFNHRVRSRGPVRATGENNRRGELDLELGRTASDPLEQGTGEFELVRTLASQSVEGFGEHCLSAGMFFFLSLCSALLLLSSAQTMIDRRNYVICIGVVFLAANFHFCAYLMKHGKALTSISVSGRQPVKTVALDRKVTSSGLSVYTPTTGDQGWTSPVPSTPYFDPQLRQRNPQSRASGFAVAQEHKPHPP